MSRAAYVLWYYHSHDGYRLDQIKRACLWHKNNAERTRQIQRNCYSKHREEVCAKQRERRFVKKLSIQLSKYL